MDLPLLDLGLPFGSESADDSRRPRVLVLADGDCAYAAALARQRPEVHVCATTYDARHRVPEEHAQAVSELLCEVDATEPLPGGARWHRVVANFPTPIGRQHVARARQLVRGLLARAAGALALEEGGGEVWLTLEAGAACRPAGASFGAGADWDVLDAAADAELVLVRQQPSRARSIYVPRGAKSDGVLHVFAPAAALPAALLPVSFVRDINLPARSSLEELRMEVSARCAPIHARVEILNAHLCESGEFWTVRVELSADRCALSRRKAHTLVEAIEGGREPRLLAPEHSSLAPRRPGWTVWFHKVEPSVEDFLALLARPVARAEDAKLVWANVAWAQPGAFVNHFEDAVLDKRGVARALRRRASPHLPRTYLLPEEAHEWAKASASLWIAKPARLGRGVSVVVFPDSEKPNDLHGVVSEYVSPPLCVGGRKVDLRLYVLVRALAPIEAYVHRNGYVRFAALPFSLFDLAAQRHLTNNSVNRVARVAPPTLPGLDLGPGDNWPLWGLWSEVDREAVWPRIGALLADAVAAVAPELRARPAEDGGGRQFALLGFDVLLDEGLRPWLCEINANPTLEARRPVDRDVDLEVIGDLLILLEGGEAPRWEPLPVPPAEVAAAAKLAHFLKEEASR